MTIRFHAVLALGLGVFLIDPALATTAHSTHHAARHRSSGDARYAQSFYDYRSASEVREEFRGGRRASSGHDGYFDRRDFYRERREGMIVENLRTEDFTGGVGYGASGDVPYFVDGYGQSHFFVGSFRRMAPMGRFGAPRFGGFHSGFR